MNDADKGLDVGMVMHTRAGRLGLPQDRAWEVCKQGEYLKFEWMRRRPCPACDKAEVAGLAHLMGCNVRVGVEGLAEQRGGQLQQEECEEGVWCSGCGDGDGGDMKRTCSLHNLHYHHKEKCRVLLTQCDCVRGSEARRRQR